MQDDSNLLARRGEVSVRTLAGPQDARAAEALLDAMERDAAAPLVDEAERHRLARMATGGEPDSSGWFGMLARRGTTVVGYAGVVLAPKGGTATGDLAVPPEQQPDGPALRALLDALHRFAARHADASLTVWLRHVGAEAAAGAADEGFHVERVLGILGRSLDDGVGPPTASETTTSPTVRGYRPGADDAAVVAILAGAYRDTAEAGWDLARFDERRALPWFRPEDLLVAEDGSGQLLGLVWLKRRDADVGEVYNLAIHPDAQGHGLGGRLLDAALEHLRAVGCTHTLLWVDMANERAVRLYRSLGFVTRWEDIALARPVGAPDASSQLSSGPRPSR